MKIADIDIRDAFFDEVYTIASQDSRVIFLTADMGSFSLNRFKADLSSQYINVGVAEQNLVSIAAGLALAGKKVFIYTIASFVTQRCYEQIKIDICGMRLPVTIIGSGPGLSYSSDGPTHHAIQDILIMRALPEMTILNPGDSTTAVAAARIAYRSQGPVYVRIDKGKLPLLYENDEDFSAGLSLLKKGRFDNSYHGYNGTASLQGSRRTRQALHRCWNCRHLPSKTDKRGTASELHWAIESDSNLRGALTGWWYRQCHCRDTG